MAKKNGKTHTDQQWRTALAGVIGKLRSKSGESQATLAKRLGTEGTYFSRIENGHVTPRLDKLEAIAALFELKTSQLLTRVEKQLAS